MTQSSETPQVDHQTMDYLSLERATFLIARSQLPYWLACSKELWCHNAADF